MAEVVLKFKRILYPKQAVMKAAYHFIDRCYIYVDVSDEEYIVKVTEKGKGDPELTAKEFENELLAQTVRYEVYSQTHVIREILMARAMSSTLTGSDTEMKKVALPDNIDSLENIVTDWFKKNEN